MAKINGLYIFVESEDMGYGVEVTEHAVEKGVEITDHVKRKGMTLSITGEIVGKNAANVLSKIKSMHQGGTLCKYVGRTSLSNCLIVEFSTGHTVDIWGGCSFTMTLKEVRTASTSYKKTKNDTKKAGTQQVTKKSTTVWVYHKVKKGDTVWALVAAPKAPYKKYGATCNQVMSWNPSAFSRRGDFRTLQIGKNIKVGKRTVTVTVGGGRASDEEH